MCVLPVLLTDPSRSGTRVAVKKHTQLCALLNDLDRSGMCVWLKMKHTDVRVVE